MFETVTHGKNIYQVLLNEFQTLSTTVKGQPHDMASAHICSDATLNKFTNRASDVVQQMSKAGINKYRILLYIESAALWNIASPLPSCPEGAPYDDVLNCSMLKKRFVVFSHKFFSTAKHAARQLPLIAIGLVALAGLWKLGGSEQKSV